MKEETHILFTAGRGPVECALAVQGIQRKFKSFLDAKNIGYDIVHQKRGDLNKSIETIVFKVLTSDRSIMDPWVGTILWICQSPIRKYHKRKNWFIKCEEIVPLEKNEVSTLDVTLQTYKASGPGGQHRNKVETAIRIIHHPTGIIVTASDSKSQMQNKKKAWAKLRAKLIEHDNMMLLQYHVDRWASQITIERGSPVKTFFGNKFKE